MYFDNPLFGLTPANQMIVNPADVFLSQPPQEPTQTPGMPYNIVELGPDYIFSPETRGQLESSQFRLPIRPAQPMGHFLSGAARPFIGPVRHFRRTFRGTPVGDAESTICQWQRLGFPICGQDITRESLSEHLAHHGIYKMHKDHIVQCCWQGCGRLVKRQSMTRHCREVHLELKRKSRSLDACFWDAFVVDVF